MASGARNWMKPSSADFSKDAQLPALGARPVFETDSLAETRKSYDCKSSCSCYENCNGLARRARRTTRARNGGTATDWRAGALEGRARTALALLRARSGPCGVRAR